MSDADLRFEDMTCMKCDGKPIRAGTGHCMACIGQTSPVAADALPTPSECPSNPPTPTGPQRGRTAMSEDKDDEVCNDCSHYLDMHSETGCECCTCEIGRADDELTDAEVDADLMTLGFDAREPYPEHGHASLREAYRAGFSQARP